MADWRYQQGLCELGNGLYAWLQPDGSWGWSNAGLVVDGDASLLVDTLFDLRLTREMLAAMRRASPAAAHIDTLVNTHANGDHCWGNQLLRGSDILASRRCAEEMLELKPSLVANLSRVARLVARGGRPAKLLTRALGRLGLSKIAAVGEAAEFLVHAFGDFDFEGIELTPPTRTFDGEHEVMVGGKSVRLIEVGPAHTMGDVIVYVAGDRTVFTGDILFVGGHPIVWAGPVSNWIRACERILDLDVDVVVPGHGPITDKSAVASLKAYFEQLHDAARTRFDAGLSVDEATADIALDGYASWTEAERLAVNVDTLYREFSGRRQRPNPVELFATMAAQWDG